MILLTDGFKKDEKQKQDEIDDFFAQFDKISNEFDNRNAEASTHTAPASNVSPNDDLLQGVNEKQSTTDSSENEIRKTRMEKRSESKPQASFAVIGTAIDSIKNIFAKKEDSDTKDSSEVSMTTKQDNTKKKKKKYTLDKKQFSKFILAVFLTMGLLLAGLVVSIIVTAPPIYPDKIYSLLTENSVLYDDSGEIMDSILTSDGMRTNVSYTELPPDLVNAFVAVEDKTFWTHHGFNFIRIMGAIKESIFEGGSISGTSTITQQLARNLYLAETKSDYSMIRKIREAYYSILLEKRLSKEQIVEAYLNTIYLGYGANGVQAASQSYFSKDVSDLTLEECAALASLAKAPDTFAFIKKYENDQVEAGNPNILYKGADLTYVYNDAFAERRDLVLYFMQEQGKITSAEYDTAMAYDLKDSIKPGQETLKDNSSYFADFVIQDVADGLVESLHITPTEAKQMVYSGGLRIHTTMNTKMQSITEKEFSNNANFPGVTNLKKDRNGNIIGSGGNILLYAYDNYIDDAGNFTLGSDEFELTRNGNLVLFPGKRLNFYKTEVQGVIDFSVEFKNMYTIEDGVFYIIQGGVLQIPQQYKEKDRDGNLIVSKKFFDENNTFMQRNGTGLTISSSYYILKQKIVQPQSAMVIYDYTNGGIKAMVGGRNVEGRLILNRANEPRQPGSSIKPIGVYGPALQSGLDAVNGKGTSVKDKSQLYGQYWTAASVIDDAKMTYNGKVWPKNWYTGYRGLTRMRTAVEQSVNTCAVKVLSDIGATNSVKFAKQLGITSIVESGEVNDINAAAMALGGMTKGVSPLEMVAAYGAFANQGMYVEPTSYTKVTNKQNEIILEKEPVKDQVMDKGVSFIMTDMMRTAVTAGIAGNASIGSQPVAGKTGTTTDNFDAWFVGYTPQYAASVWIGNDINIELSQGSAAATRVWAKVMKQVHAGLPSGSFVRPDNVISVAVDADSGMRPNGGTTINEYFIKGTEPSATDNLHTTADVCNDSGYLATPYCPNHGPKGFLNRTSASKETSGSVPTYYCNLHNLDVKKYPISPDVTWNQNFIPENTSGGGLDEQDNTDEPTNSETNPDLPTNENLPNSDPPSWITN